MSCCELSAVRSIRTYLELEPECITVDFEAFTDKNHWSPWQQPLATLGSQSVSMICQPSHILWSEACLPVVRKGQDNFLFSLTKPWWRLPAALA
jgi:hypothetical protein